jgi:hypothetical protein
VPIKATDQGRAPALLSRQITPVRTALAIHHGNDLILYPVAWWA